MRWLESPFSELIVVWHVVLVDTDAPFFFGGSAMVNDASISAEIRSVTK